MSDELDPSIAALLNSAPADSSGHEEISITEFESDKKFDMNSFASKNNLFEKKDAPAASGPASGWPRFPKGPFADGRASYWWR